MLALYIISGIIAFIFLILIIPIRIKIVKTDDVKVIFYYGFIKFDTSKKSKRKTKVKNKKTPKKSDNAPKTSKSGKKKEGIWSKIKKGRSSTETISFIKDSFVVPVLKEIPKLTHHIHIKPLYVNVVLGDESKTADELAIEYGEFCTVFYPTMGLLASSLDIKKQIINAKVDYTAKSNDARFLIVFHTLPLHLTASGFRAVFKIIFNIIRDWLAMKGLCIKWVKKLMA